MPGDYECNGACGKDGCAKSYTSQKNLTRHTSPKHIACPEQGCNTTFTENTTLKRHLKNSHAEEIRRFECTGCDYAAKTQYALESHMRTHTGTLPFVCAVCGEAFAHNTTLSDHVARIHSDERPHECPECDANFKTARDLREHAKRHLSEESMPFQCAECGTGWPRSSEYRRHLSTHA